MEAKYIVRSLEGKLRIGNAERSVLVSLAHAAVLAEKERGEAHTFFLEHNSELTSLRVADKRWSQDKLTARLEEGAEIMKAVYRCVLVVNTSVCFAHG